MFAQLDDYNLVVQEDMERIASEFKDNESIILFGSYAKGEGGLVDGMPVNDYDLLVYVESKKEFEDIKRRILELGLRNKPEVHQLQPSKIDSLPCTQQWFEISRDMKVLSGETPKFPDWKEYDIPFLDAINSLERRAISMILAKHEMLKEDANWDKVMRQIGKMIIALGDAVLIKRGQFATSYRTRALMLGQDDISELYNTAVAYKLLSTPDMSEDQIWNLWTMVRNYYYKYVTSSNLSLPIGNALLAIDETTPQDKIKDLLINLGSEEWL